MMFIILDAFRVVRLAFTYVSYFQRFLISKKLKVNSSGVSFLPKYIKHVTAVHSAYTVMLQNCINTKNWSAQSTPFCHGWVDRRSTRSSCKIYSLGYRLY